MRAKVTKRGIIIPKEFLEGVEEVDIRKDDGVIIVTPLGDQDPIWGLGENPVEADISDAAENHDRYIYG